jgi:hypothetical protein
MSNADCKELKQNFIITGFLQSAANPFAWRKRLALVLALPSPDCGLFWSHAL